MDTKKLVRDMREDGMSFRWSAWDTKPHSQAKKYKLLPKPENENKEEVNCYTDSIFLLHRILSFKIVNMNCYRFRKYNLINIWPEIINNDNISVNKSDDSW